MSLGVPQTYTLMQILSEMDTALADEIKAQSTKRSANHVAVDGKLIAEESGQYVYAFSLQDPWEPEDDTPVRVRIIGIPIIRGYIVSSTGTVITVATESPLPPEGLGQIELVDDPTELLERLREALKKNNEGSAQLEAKVFGLTSYGMGKQSLSVLFGRFKPDISQKKAIEMALGSEVMYLIGPPGTGKTSTLAAMAFAHLCEGRTVLIAAHTNIAVDNAIMKLAEMCQDTGARELQDNLIVRYGTPQDRRLIDDDKYRDVYLPKIIKRRGSDLNQQVEALKASLKQVTEQLARLKQTRQQGNVQREVERENLSKRCEAVKQGIAPLQAREVQRHSSLTVQLNEVHRQWPLAEQRMKSVQQELGKMTAEQVQLQTAREQHLERVGQISQQLAAAQQMNALKRLLKGIHPERIEQQLLEIKQQVWREEQWLNDLQARIDAAHRTYEMAIYEVRRLSSNYPALKTALETPSDDAKKIAHLQESLTHFEGQIKALETSLKREQGEYERQCHSLESRRVQFEEEIAAIDGQLANLEKSIVANAHIVATTLSKVYMSQSLSERRFDGVILDEVSMAPLPAVYVAASRADQSIVTIGDPKQLAPIVEARGSEFAERWLGTDIFAHRKITLENAERSGIGNSTVLTMQSRMHPDISVVARNHIYGGVIEDRDNKEAVKWQKYAKVSPVPEKRLLLCDTSDAMPFVTRPEGGSRINIYHALCVIALARQILPTLPQTEPEQGNMHRIGLVTPYAKQARLLQQLIRDTGLKDLVRAGTVHKFQGLEFDVVIFDTVESSPLPPVPDFTMGKIGSKAMRLINVAVTRPRHKLIIVANRDYIQRTFQEDDIMRLAVQEARDALVLKSREILTIPLPSLSEALRSLLPQNEYRLLGRSEALNVTQYELQLLNEHSFFPLFQNDLQTARKEIILFSPFLTPRRTTDILPNLVDRHRAGVRVIVYTKPIEESNKTAGNAAPLLRKAGIELINLSDMHQKLVLIDEETVYLGSLNILSHRDSSEIMVRVKSPGLAKEILKMVDRGQRRNSKTARVRAKQGPEIIISRWELPTSTCERCGKKVVVKYGRNGFFYGCNGYRKDSSDSCGYSEDISEKHLGGLQSLQNIECRCNTSEPMQVKTQGKERWLECATPTPCGYWQPITIADDPF